MSTPYINELNQRFGLIDNGNRVCFKNGKGGIPVIEIENEQAKALVSLQGAHLLSWQPNGQDEVIWLSQDARFVEGKSVRGGIPICWPWFGAHSKDASLPAHGFARTVLWEVSAIRQLATGEVQISFSLKPEQQSEVIQDMWPALTSVEYTLTIGTSLKLELITHNNGKNDVVIGEALHTYFNVGDVRHTHVAGLDGKDYLDKPDSFKRKKQSGVIKINEEVDRVYLQTAGDIVIDNQQRKIIITKQGSESTIVWNPWKQVAEKMGDLGEDGYLKMLCVESGNAAEDTIRLAAGESHTLQVMYSLKAN